MYFQVPIQVFCCEFGNFFQKSFCAEHIWENIDDIIFSFDDIIGTIVMLCAIWYHLYNLEKAKSTHGGVLLLVKLQVCNFDKSNTPPWVFFTFFKLYKWLHIVQNITILCAVPVSILYML